MIIRFLTILTLFMTTMSIHAQAGQSIVYKHANVPLEGYWAPSKCIKENPGKKFPTIIVLHQWMGLGAHEKDRADTYANNTTTCYNAFAADLYGQGIRPQNKDEALAESTKYRSHPDLAIKRIQTAINFVKALGVVDGNKIALVGYSFGGGFAIDYARSGGAVQGVVSFYGNLKSRLPETNPARIKTPIEVHNGANDTYITARHIERFKKEMGQTSIVSSFYNYDGAVHGFSQKDVGNDPSTGLAYNADVDKTSWERHLNFLASVFK